VQESKRVDSGDDQLGSQRVIASLSAIKKLLGMALTAKKNGLQAVSWGVREEQGAAWLALRFGPEPPGELRAAPRGCDSHSCLRVEQAHAFSP